jgi:hypothetical protein
MPSKPITRRCILLARTVGPDRDDAARTQVEMMCDYARQQNLVVAGIMYVPYTTATPEIERAIEVLLRRKAVANDFDTLVATELSRISRDSHRDMSSVMRLAKAGIEVETLAQGPFNLSVARIMALACKPACIFRCSSPRTAKSLVTGTRQSTVKSQKKKGSVRHHAKRTKDDQQRRREEDATSCSQHLNEEPDA